MHLLHNFENIVSSIFHIITIVFPIKRRDYFHKLLNDIAKKYDYFCIEDLNMKAIQMLWGRKISDLFFIG